MQVGKQFRHFARGRCAGRCATALSVPSIFPVNPALAPGSGWYSSFRIAGRTVRSPITSSIRYKGGGASCGFRFPRGVGENPAASSMEGDPVVFRKVLALPETAQCRLGHIGCHRQLLLSAVPQLRDTGLHPRPKFIVGGRDRREGGFDVAG